MNPGNLTNEPIYRYCKPTLNMRRFSEELFDISGNNWRKPAERSRCRSLVALVAGQATSWVTPFFKWGRKPQSKLKQSKLFAFNKIYFHYFRLNVLQFNEATAHNFIDIITSLDLVLLNAFLPSTLDRSETSKETVMSGCRNVLSMFLSITEKSWQERWTYERHTTVLKLTSTGETQNESWIQKVEKLWNVRADPVWIGEDAWLLAGESGFWEAVHQRGIKFRLKATEMPLPALKIAQR